MTGRNHNTDRHSYAAAKLVREYAVRVYEMTKADRPRERLLDQGAKALSLAELVAILLHTGNGQQGLSALDLAHAVCQQLAPGEGSAVRSLRTVTAAELMQVAGIGEAKAARLVAAIELGQRIWLEGDIQRDDRIESPEDAVRALSPLIAGKPVEHLAVLHLDIKHRIKSRQIISIGSIDETIASARDVFRLAVREAAPRLIVGHNHPSGNAEPSPDDLRMTRTLVQAGKVLDIEVLDHIVIGDGAFESIRAIDPSLFT